MTGQARPIAFRDVSHGVATFTGTISGSVVPVASLSGYDATKIATAVRATITAIANGVNFTYDGSTAPSDTVGHTIGAGQSVVVTGTVNLSQLKFIKSGASDASLTMTIEQSP